MSCLLRGLKWPKTGLRENRVIFQFPDVFKHSPKTGWWPKTGGFTLFPFIPLIFGVIFVVRIVNGFFSTPKL